MTDPVVVVGAGLGGLSAAICLAAAGVPVHVVERAERPGGKAGIAVVDGVEVDTGPSVLTLPGVFDDVLARAGTRLGEVVDVRLPRPACRYLFPEGPTVDVHTGVAPTLAAVRDALGPVAADELRDFLAYTERIWDAAHPWFIDGPAPTVARVLGYGPRAWAATLRIDAWRTMDRALDAMVHTPELRAILQRYATYNGSDPRRAPATLHCIAHVEVGLGVYAVGGGIHALVRALEGVARQAGATFAYGTGVTGLDLVGGRACGVRLADGTRVRASAVVANADARHVLQDLLPPGTRHGLVEEPEPSMSGWVGILRARRRDDRVGHTVAFPRRPYVHEFHDIFDRDQPPEAPTVYVCAQERAHAREGWDDGEPLFVMANTPAEPAHGQRPRATWDRLRARVRKALHDHDLVHPDDPIVWERAPPGLARQFPGTRGAIYGSASNDPFAAFRRPPNRVVRVPGLYLASGSAHPGGGMPLCVLSGRAAADRLLDDRGLSR